MNTPKEREISVFALIDILENKGYNSIVLKRTFMQNKNLDIKQKAFVTELVNGTLRNLIHIDYIIDYFSNTKTTKMKPLILNTLRISVYQIKFMDKVPSSAVCNEAVNLVKSKGFKNLAGFINGVLRNIIRNIEKVEYPDYEKNKTNYLSIKYSYPKWLIQYFMESLSIKEVEKLCISGNDTPKVCICTNTLKTTRDKLIKRLNDEGVQAVEGKLSKNSIYISKTSNIAELLSFKEGLFHVMDESSMVAVETLSPNSGDTVYDLCSAPGGKSFYSSYLMKNIGTIESWDIYRHKLNLIEEGYQRLGIDIIKTYEKDASKYHLNKEGIASHVIIDAPCTGFGLLRKKPDIKYNKTKEDVFALAKLQREILTKACKYVKLGGVLVYSTCTISEEENMKNINWFIKNYNYELMDLNQMLPSIHFTDGFFIAKMIRRG